MASEKYWNELLAEFKNMSDEDFLKAVQEAEKPLPAYVYGAMDILAQGGGTPYIVGGAVRDMVMGRTPKDYDIASDLLPDEVISILEKNEIPVVDKLGNNFGVVVGVFDGNPIEIATFRSDVYGNSDAHRPESVSFTKTIEEDLSRRDFTCNALAMGIDGTILDPYHGVRDIGQRVLCPVGEAKDRYKEDPLRMYRACRFVSQLGFTYTEDGVTPSDVFVKKDFWKDCGSKHLSCERVRQEVEKMLVGEYASHGLRLFMTSGLVSGMCEVRAEGRKEYIAPFQDLAHLYNLSQNPTFHRFDAWEHTICAVDNVLLKKDVEPENKLRMRYAALFHDAGKGLPGVRVMNDKGQPSDFMHGEKSVAIVEKSLSELGYGKSFIRKTKWVVANHMDFIPLLEADEKRIKRWVRRKSEGFRKKDELVAGLEDLRAMFLADLSASRDNAEDMQKIADNMEYAIHFANRQMCLHSSDLAISGEKVRNLVAGTNVSIKDGFRNLLHKVQEEKVENTEQALASSLSKFVLRRQEQSLAK